MLYLKSKCCKHHQAANEEEISNMNEKYIVQGPEPLIPMPRKTAGEIIYEHLNNFQPSKVAMVDGIKEETLTYGEFLATTLKLADSLYNYGCKENITIVQCCENSIWFHCPMIASLYVGSIIMPINPNFTEKEILHAMNLTKPKVVFCNSSVIDKFRRIRNQISYVKKIILIDTNKSEEDAVSMNTFINNHKKLGVNFKPLHFDNSKTSIIFMSSGTTGFPKGVMIADKSLSLRLLMIKDPRNSSTISSPIVAFLPFFHMFGYLMVMRTVIMGEKVIVMRKFVDKIFLKTVQDYKISRLILVPTLATFLTKSPVIDEYDLSCVFHIFVAGAPLSTEVEGGLKKRFKNLQFVSQSYGLTESTSAATGFTINDKKKIGSSGKVVPYMSIKVRDIQTGKPLGPNKSGEICLKGPFVMNGYYNDEDATKKSFDEDGWLLTGDIGYYDEDGYFYIVDRLKELIKYKSYQVAPAELEAILLQHPDIAEAAVVGLPDEECGEIPMAFVVLQPHSTLTEAEIKNLVAEQVSSHKKLRGGVIFTSSIPKNATGKIMRKELRDLLKTKKSKL